MSRRPPIDEFGFASIDDASTLRRRYAGLLRAVRPEDDPDRFARLRHAYEAHLERLRYADRAHDESILAAHPDPRGDDVPVEDAQPPLPTPLPDETPRTVEDFAPALDAPQPFDDPVETILGFARAGSGQPAALVDRLRSTLDVATLAQARVLERRLARALVHGGPWDADALRVLVERFEWDRMLLTSNAPPELQSPAFQDLVEGATREPEPSPEWPDTRPAADGSPPVGLIVLGMLLFGSVVSVGLRDSSLGVLDTMRLALPVDLFLLSLACAWGAWRFGARSRSGDEAQAAEARWRRNILALFAVALAVASAVIARYG